MSPGSAFGVTLAQPARAFSSGRWWPRVELAAMMLVVLALAAVLAGDSGLRDALPGSDESGRVVAPGSSTSPTPTTVATTTPPPTIGTAWTPPQVGDVLVTTETVNLRSSPTTMDTAVVRQLPAGTEVVVTDALVKAEGIIWVPVQVVVSGETGYVVEDFVLPPDQTPPIEAKPLLIGDVVQTAEVTVLRAAPVETAEVVTTLAPQTDLVLTGPAFWENGRRWWPARILTSNVSGYVLESALVQPSVNATPTPSQRSDAAVTVVSNPATVTPIPADDFVVPTPTKSIETAVPVETPPSARFAVGDTVFVSQSTVILRAEPSFSGAEVVKLSLGTRLTIIGESQEAQGVVWWPVGDPATGTAGFIVEDGLSAQQVTPTATVGEGFVDTSGSVEVSVTIDADGLLGQNEQARLDAIDTLARVLEPYAACRVGFAQTFGYSASISEGVDIARAINELLKEEFPEQFSDAVVDDFANVGQERGRVDIQLYFYRGCVRSDTSDSTATAGQTPTPTLAGTPQLAATETPKLLSGDVYAGTSTSIATVPPSTDATGVAVLFLIDKSGSMSYDPLGGTTKLETEKETIRRAVAAAPDGTTIGVLAFNDHQTWIVPPTTILQATSEADRRRIIQAVDAIMADGGSELPDALRAAFGAIRAEPDGRAKHVVLLSDGKSRAGDEQTYRGLIGDAVADGITLSTIAFGNDADTAVMQRLAELGNGQYHLVVAPEDVPKFNFGESDLDIERAGDSTPTPTAGMTSGVAVGGEPATATSTAALHATVAAEDVSVAEAYGGLPASPMPTAPTSTVVFLIDTSVGNGDDSGSQPSDLELEKETVRRAISAVPDGMTIAVLAFDEGETWVVPTTSIDAASSAIDRQQIIASIDAIQPGEGSYLTPALMSISGPPRGTPIPGPAQIVLISDGRFDDHDMFAYRDVIEGMGSRGITFSTIAVGDYADTETMRWLATYGNGDIAYVPTAASLPALTVRQGRLDIADVTATPAAGA